MDTPTGRVFDGHNDTLLHLYLPDRGLGRSIFERSEIGDVDLPRARDGNYAGGFFAVFVPNESTSDLKRTDDGYEVPLASAVPTARAKRFTHDVLARLYSAEEASNGEFTVVRTTDELEGALDDESVVAAIAHLEGAAAIEPDLSNLDFLYAAGVRSIGLTWSRPNAFGHGVPFRYPGSPDTGPGLTENGRDLVRACNERGIVVDLAHLNEAGFWDVAELSDAPLVVSHAGAHARCPSTRNLTDAQLAAVAETNGVVGVTFDLPNIRPDGENDPETPLSVYVEHVEHIVDRIGIEHVALGSDFDGCRVPNAVTDVTGLPRVMRELRDSGFGRGDRRRFARENWLRVIGETWR